MSGSECMNLCRPQLAVGSAQKKMLFVCFGKSDATITIANRRSGSGEDRLLSHQPGEAGAGRQTGEVEVVEL